MLSLLLALGGAAHGREPSAALGRSSTGVPSAELGGAVAFAVAEYEWLHAHPELSNQERATAARLADALRGLGFDVHEGVGGTGVVAVLTGQGPGPTVLYRADMDGLPVTEKTKLPYASQNPGVMHACGHDLHMATALGALRVMSHTRQTWSGAIVFVAQPAEEIGAGARQMLADGRFRSLLARYGKPSVALALHDAADLPAGQVALSSGYTTANVDSVTLTLHGKDGHGARPHETVDPIVMAAEVVLQLQTIVSRRIPPDQPAVISVGKIQAGTSHNIIPSSAELLITVRSRDDVTRQKLLTEIEHIATSVAASYHAPAPPTFVLRDGFTPSNLNDEAWSRRLGQRFTALLGAGRVVPIPPSMGGDDFARFSRDLGVPGVYWRLGAVAPSAFASRERKPLPGLHSAEWAPDVRTALPVGIQTVVAALDEGLARVK